MKVKSFIIIFVFISCFSFSQEKVKDPYKGWYFGPGISYSTIDGFYSKKQGFDPTFRNNRISYSIGLDALYTFGRKHSLSFGINYQEARSSYKYYWPVDSLSNSAEINTTYNRWISKKLIFPVSMNFCLFKGNVSPYIITGLIPSISLSDNHLERTTYVNGVKKENRNYYSHPELSLDWQFGIGIDVNLTKSRFRVFVYDSSPTGPVLYTLLVDGFWGYSIHTGISYYLKTSHR